MESRNYTKSCLTLVACAMLSTSNLIAQKNLLVGGIHQSNMNTENGVLRSLISQSLSKNNDYVLLDRFDVTERIPGDSLNKCMGVGCLTDLGTLFNADFAMSASFEKLDDRIMITFKLVDVDSGKVVKTESRQFESQEDEIAKIVDLMVNYFLAQEVDVIAERNLIFKEMPANSMNLQKLDNSGPRMGFGVVTGENGEYLTRSAIEGGLNGGNVVYNLGYQFESQYVGGDKFSGLFEFIFNFAGLERSKVFPSMAILHGLRFGKGAWEFAFGPSLTIRRMAHGINYQGKFRTEDEFYELTYEPYSDQPYPYEPSGDSYSNYKEFKRPDTRGHLEFGTNFIVGFGKTFRAGSLNIPLNFYTSINKYGTTYGLSLGVNILKSKTKPKKTRDYQKSNVRGRYDRNGTNSENQTIIIRQN